MIKMRNITSYKSIYYKHEDQFALCRLCTNLYSHHWTQYL